MRESFWVSVRVPVSEICRAPYLAAAKARKEAGGLKVACVSSGGSVNITPGVYEERRCYVLQGVSLVKRPHEVWVFTNKPEHKPRGGVAWISAHRTQALAHAAALRIQAGPSFEGYCQVRAA